MFIVQPYVPHYRVAFFEGLRTKLAADGVELHVVADRPEGAQAHRRDAADLPWITPFRQRRITLGRRSLAVGTSMREWRSGDAVIVGHLGSSLDTNLALLRARFGSIKVGVWGHIGSYVSDPNPIDARIERWQVRTADHVFAYTPGGAEFALRLGAHPERVTSVMNTVDTMSLENAVRGVTDDEVATFVAANRLDPRKTFSFIGGIDQAKRIEWLAIALDHLWKLDPSIRILFAGRGSDQHLLQRAVDRGQAIMLGYADDHLKALLGRVSRGLLVPGRIGLVAVDALILGVPVLTTAWRYHAPEVEYLVRGESMLASDDTPDAYARMVRDIADEQEPRRFVGAYPRLETMIDNFADGVSALLAR